MKTKTSLSDEFASAFKWLGCAFVVVSLTFMATYMEQISKDLHNVAVSLESCR